MFSGAVRGVVPEPGFLALPGIGRLSAYLHERLPSTPHARLLGYRVTQIGAGSAVLSQPLSSWFEIYDGFIDLTPTAQLSIYLAALTVAPPGTDVRPVTLSIRYLRPCTVENETAVARSRVLHTGSQFTTVESLIEDSLGRSVAHATGCVLIAPVHPPPPAGGYALTEATEEPTYSTPDPVVASRPQPDPTSRC
jgi:acyl-coenzyme A thioesterase PaaI-like protein